MIVSQPTLDFRNENVYVLASEKHERKPFLLLPAGWNTDLMAGNQRTILDHNMEGQFSLVTQSCPTL